MAQIASTIGPLSGAFVSSIGALYLLSPTRAAQGLRLPIPQPVEIANNWFRIKGIRDVVSGLILISSIAYAPRKIAGIVTILDSLIPSGDAWIVWAARARNGQGWASCHHWGGCTASCTVFCVVEGMKPIREQVSDDWAIHQYRSWPEGGCGNMGTGEASRLGKMSHQIGDGMRAS